MALSKALIEQFQALHLAKYGEQIDYAVAEIQLKELTELVRITTPQKESKNAKDAQSRCTISYAIKKGRLPSEAATNRPRYLY